jgi:MFS family permease
MNSAGDRRWAVLAVVSVAQFLTVLDLWVANIALPTLERAFHPASLPDVSWILAIYAIVLRWMASTLRTVVLQ